MSDKQTSLHGRVAALAVDFGARARNMWTGVESMLGSGHEFDAAELSAVGKAWADASAALWSLVGSEPKHDTDRALVRIGMSDLAALLAREEQLTRRVAELEAERAGGMIVIVRNALMDIARTPNAVQANKPLCPECSCPSVCEAPPQARGKYQFECTNCRALFDAPKNQQDTMSLYIAGGSSERLTVCQPRIDRAMQLGARITYDWTRTPNYDVTRPSDLSIRADAERDIAAVLRADILWIMVPQQLSEGASTELGVALGARCVGSWNGRIVMSGEHARRNIFALLADEIYETHDQAWEALKPRVIGAGEHVTM